MTTPKAIEILLIEDNAAEARLIRESLADLVFLDQWFTVTHVERMAQAQQLLQPARFDAVLLDLSLPDSSGLDTLERINALAPQMPILVLTGLDDEALATRAIRCGAQDYLLKGLLPPRALGRAIHYAVERKRLETERERLLEENRAQRKILEALMEHVPEGITIADAPGLVIRAISRQGLEMVGLAAAGAEGHPVGKTLTDSGWQLYHADGVTVCRREEAPLVRAVEKEEIVSNEEWLLRRVDQTDLPILCNAAPIRDSQGNITGGVIAWRDISDRRRAALEEERAKRAAEDANRAKSQFLANISHELRTPMNAILGMTQLALAEPLQPVVRDYLETVKDSGDVLLALLNEILDFSRIEAGKFTLESAPFGLRQAIEGTMKTMAIRAHEKGLELACDLPNRIPDAVIGDALRLRQILTNLIGNAIKFTQAGEVVIRVREAPVREAVADGQPAAAPDDLVLEFAVADTGIGISLQDQSRIFAPFAQADSSTTRLYGGTGLGLAIASSLVSLMGGRIWVESQPGRGSTFRFTIRLRRQARFEAPRSEADLFAQLRGVPVLVAEDNDTSRGILQTMLASWAMLPETVANGRTALERIHQAAAANRPFPLAFLDADMPEIDGFTLVEWIKSDRHLVGKPILMLTSVDRQLQARRCERLEVIHIEKPIVSSVLARVLARVLGNDRVVEASAESRIVQAHPATRPLQVLLAEDTPANQKLVARILAKRGHRVELASNGREAIQQVARGRFDLVLMDIQMPVMDGFEATAAIRAMSDGEQGRLPIIAMTAHAMKGDRQRCLDAGMNGYLAKPINARELIDVVESFAPLGRPAMP